MSIFDEVKRSISSTGKQVAKRTKEISDAVSIRSQINEEKENVAKLYATVGKKVFQNATEADEEKFFMEFTSIRSSLETVSYTHLEVYKRQGYSHRRCCTVRSRR